MVQIKYLGHSAFYIEGKGIKALIDPFLTGNPSACCSPEDFNVLDFLFVTHGHGDHVGDTPYLAKKTGATIVANYELCNLFQKSGLVCHPMHLGGTFSFPFGRVKMTPAIHGSDVEVEGKLMPGGNPGGFLLEVDGKKIYHSGDTGLTYDMCLLEDEKVDVALIPIGGNFTMDIADAIRAVKMIKPAMVIPMHYNTFDIIKCDPEEFKTLAQEYSDILILKPGEKIFV